MFGSGAMTERAAKLTRLPIMLERNNPDLRSTSCLMPGGSVSAFAPLAPLLLLSTRHATAWLRLGLGLGLGPGPGLRLRLRLGLGLRLELGLGLRLGLGLGLGLGLP